MNYDETFIKMVYFDYSYEESEKKGVLKLYKDVKTAYIPEDDRLTLKMVPQLVKIYRLSN